MEAIRFQDAICESGLAGGWGKLLLLAHHIAPPQQVGLELVGGNQDGPTKCLFAPLPFDWPRAAPQRRGGRRESESTRSSGDILIFGPGERDFNRRAGPFVRVPFDGFDEHRGGGQIHPKGQRRGTRDDPYFALTVGSLNNRPLRRGQVGVVKRYPPSKGSAQLCFEGGFFERLKGRQRGGGRRQLGGFGQFPGYTEPYPVCLSER